MGQSSSRLRARVVMDAHTGQPAEVPWLRRRGGGGGGATPRHATHTPQAALATGDYGMAAAARRRRRQRRQRRRCRPRARVRAS